MGGRPRSQPTAAGAEEPKLGGRVNGQYAGQRRGRYLLAFGLLALGGAGVFLGGQNFTIRAAGILAIIGSVRLVRPPRLVQRSSLTGVELEQSRSDRRAWIALAAGIVAAVAVLVALQIDAQHGGRQAWPVYAFAGAMIWVTLAGAFVIFRRSF